MRILHFGLSPNTGGIERNLLRLASNVDRARFQFDFVDLHHGRAAYRQELERLGGRFHDLPSRRESPVRSSAAWKSLFRDLEYDLFHFHVNTLSYAAPLRTALGIGCPVIVHSHSSNSPKSRQTRFLHQVNQALVPLERVERVAVSKGAGHWMFGPRLSFTTIANGVDLEQFGFRAEWRSQLRADMDLEDSFVVGHVGTFLPVKNHRFLLEVFQRVLARQPNSVLVMVGDGPERRAVESAARTMGVGSHTRFLGVRDDVAQLLSSFDGLLFPSRYEGFPNVVVEAQCSGLPCVVSTAVPEDALVVPDMSERLSLSDTADTWAQRLIELREANGNRAAASAAVGASGLGSDTEIRIIEQLYLENGRRSD